MTQQAFHLPKAKQVEILQDIITHLQHAIAEISKPNPDNFETHEDYAIWSAQQKLAFLEQNKTH